MPLPSPRRQGRQRDCGRVTGTTDLRARARPMRVAVGLGVTTAVCVVDFTRAPGRPGGRPRPSHETPVYDALIADWTAFGRIVPGQRDREWVELVTRRPWR